MTNIFYDRLGNEHFKPDDREIVGRVSAYGICLKADKILLIKSPDFTNWDIPGGEVEKEETIEEGLKREFLEETGYNITRVIEKIGQKEQFFYSIKRDVYHKSQAHFFLVEMDESVKLTDKMTPDESEKVEWFYLKALDIKILNPFTESVIMKLKKKFKQ